MFFKSRKVKESTAGSKTGETEKNPSPADGISTARKKAILTFKSSFKANSKAEMLWTLKCLVSVFSNYSSHVISRLLKHMYSDNERLKRNLKWGRTKLMFINNFGLASHFKDLLYSKIKV